MTSAREQILQTTSNLLEKQGCHATGLNEIIRQSGAPKGSLYYYFPDGKDQLVSEAILATGEAFSSHIRSQLTTSGLRAFILAIAENVQASGFAAGSPLSGVAIETAVTNPRINQACQQAYGMMMSAFEEYLSNQGVPAPKAAALASFIVAAIEGGVILSRTNQSIAPLQAIATQLGDCLGVG